MITTADLHIIIGCVCVCVCVSSVCKYVRYVKYAEGRLSVARTYSARSDKTWKQKSAWENRSEVKSTYNK